MKLCDHFQSRGLDKRILDWIFQKVRHHVVSLRYIIQPRSQIAPGAPGLLVSLPPQRFEKYSPTILAHNLSSSSVNLSRYFPPTTVIHGATDVSAPCSGGVEFYDSLKLLGVKADLIVYESMSHTDPILEKPFAGEQQLHEDIYNLMRKWGEGKEHEFVDFDGSIPSCRRVAPQIMIDVARKANPF